MDFHSVKIMNANVILGYKYLHLLIICAFNFQHKGTVGLYCFTDTWTFVP